MVAWAMDNTWKTIEPETISKNVFTLIGKEWMLITAGTVDDWNTMTASWGGLGVLWSKNVSFCFVSNSRYTFEFMNRSELYTLSFFDPEHKKALNYCGTYSGRDVDKAAQTGLIPMDIDQTVSFEQAKMVIVCRKIYHQDIDPDLFLDETIETNYPAKDYHRIYVGEIEKVYTRA